MTRSLAAELYALTHRGNPGDGAYYEQFCRGAANALELGSGYGRLLPQLARGVPRVVGLELDPALLALARASLRGLPLKRRRAIDLRLGDMRQFELGERFERIVVPYNGLLCLLNQRELLACLRCVRAALTDEGVFACDVWNADRFQRPARAERAEAQPIFSVVQRGRLWTVSEQTRFRPRQILDVRYDYRPERGAAQSLGIRQRYLRSAELLALCERAGLRVRSRQGDFQGARFRASSPQLVLSATRA